MDDQYTGDSVTPDSISHEDQPASQSERICILILGMHRSGTSALARTINIAGAKLPNHLMGAGIGNELGHWEPVRLANYHDELLCELNTHWNDWRKVDWNVLSLSRRQQIRADIVRQLESDYGEDELIVLKEPRICRFAPFFLEALAEAGYDVRVIIPLRNPLEIADSLRKRGDIGTAETTHYHSSLLWLRHVLDAEIATRGIPRAVISYDSLLSNWRETLTLLSRRLNLCWPNDPDEIGSKIQSFLASEQWHHRYSTEDLYAHQDTHDWVTQSYETMLTLQHNPYSKNALKVLDRVRQRFNDAEPMLRGLLAEDQRIYQVQIEGLNSKIHNREIAIAEDRRIYQVQIEGLNTKIHNREIAIADYENKIQTHEEETRLLKELLDGLKNKVDRRKRRQRRIKAILSNPVKYLWEEMGNTTRVARA